jgi:hypothetical protein
MKVTTFVIGPFQWWNPYGKWKFQFHPAGLWSFLGQTMVVPLEIEDFRRRKIL